MAEERKGDEALMRCEPTATCRGPLMCRPGMVMPGGRLSSRWVGVGGRVEGDVGMGEEFLVFRGGGEGGGGGGGGGGRKACERGRACP